MKYSELNEREKKAYTNMKWAINDYTGLWENALENEEEGSGEWNKAYEALNNRELMKETIYQMGTTTLCRNGCQWNDERLVKDIRLCGKEWLMEVIEQLMVKEGY